MQYRIDKRTGNKLSVLGFGCMRLPRTMGAIDCKKADQLIMSAIHQGVNYFDVAYLYPGSEAALGQVLQENKVRDQVYIATKLPIGSCKKTEDFLRFFNKQLTDLKTNYVDYYLMHNINSFRQWQSLCELGICDWITAQKEKGTIRSIGFSFHGPCLDFIEILNSYDWDFCQIQYNYFDRHYQAGVTGLKAAAQKGLAVIIMEPLLGGKLATGLPPQAVQAFKQVDPHRSPASWGLRWLLDQPEVTVILSGMNSPEQVNDNLETASQSHPGMLSCQEHQAYEKVLTIFQDSYRIHCTGCGYCMPCPHGVHIPECFAAYNTSFSMGRLTGLFQYVMGTGASLSNQHMPGRCTGCGACEVHCPQQIQIRKELVTVRKRLEPFYLKWGLALSRKMRR